MRLFISALIFITLSAKAQKNVSDEIFDTAKRIDPRYGNRESLIRNFAFNSLQDSSMLFFQQYDKAKKDHIAIQSLGDVSSPFLNLFFQPFTEQGFVTGINPFGNLYYRKEDAIFHNARLPFTEFYYTQGKSGTRGMIYFDAMHTQNIGKQFNITARYHSTTNGGFYKRQTVSVFKNIQVSSYYHSKDNRYLASVILTWNKARFMENGGLEQSAANDSLFRSYAPSVRIVPVELNNTVNTNRLREHQLTQTYWLKVKHLDDTGKTMVPQIGINHSFTAFKQGNYFTDQATDYGFYDSVYYANGKYSADSIGFTQYSNQVEIFSPLKDKGVSFKAGIQYDHFNYYQQVDPLNYYRFIGHNTSVHGQFNFNFLKTFNSEAYWRYFIEGYNQTDYFLRWTNEALIIPQSQISFNAQVMASARQPFFQQERMFSNHFRWENNFLQTSQKTISFGIDKGVKRPSGSNAFYYARPKKAFSLRANYSLIDNMIYYDRNAMPNQGGKGQNVFQLFGMLHINLKKFQLHQELAYQVFSKELASILLLPDYMSKTSLYFQTYAFHKATFVQIGFDVYYVPDYQAKFYNPGTLNFQLSDKHVGAYPFMDFFINAEVKTARFFIKLEHFNQLAENFKAGKDYPYSFPNYLYTSPYQPSAPVRLRLGLAWKFYY